MDVSRFMEQPVKEFSPLPRGLLGPGASEQIGTAAADLGLKHVLVVTSRLRGSGIVDDVIGHLERAGVSTTLYDKVESNPKDYNCMDAYQAYTEAGCDGFVSVGGGSSHDTTKGAKTVVAHDGRNINEFQGNNTTETMNMPHHIAVNTTVGTGSETSNLMVITDTASERAPHKWTTTDKNIRASLSVNDPVYVATTPPQYIAFTGFDTFAHGSECYVSRNWLYSSQPLALVAVRLASENLREFYHNPNNYNACMNMIWAEYIATQAFSSGMLGLLHTVSHAICAYYDIHHGTNNLVGISRVWDFNRSAAADRFVDIAQAMGVDTRNLTKPQAADRAIEEIIQVAKDVDGVDNLSQHMAVRYEKSRVGGQEPAGGPENNWYRHNQPDQIDDTYLDEMVQHMMMDLCNAGNPRDVTPEACRALLEDMIHDDFTVRTRMSRLPGESRMAGATGSRDVTGQSRVEPPARPIYGPSLV